MIYKYQTNVVLSEIFTSFYSIIYRCLLKNIQQKNFNLKWTRDQRKLHQSIGNVGIAIQLLEETDNQSPDKQCSLCIGNGKENIEFFEKHLSHIKNYLETNFINGTLLISSETSIDLVEINSFFIADLKHVWDTCSVVSVDEILINNNDNNNNLINNNDYELTINQNSNELISTNEILISVMIQIYIIMRVRMKMRITKMVTMKTTITMMIKIIKKMI